VRALAVGEAVFIALGTMQTAATGFILVYVTANAGSYCDSHADRAAVALDS
jgi:hypothetical protein